jgi:hypothetical protein
VLSMWLHCLLRLIDDSAQRYNKGVSQWVSQQILTGS